MRRFNNCYAEKKRRIYSEAFKRKVVQDILDGVYSPWRAREIYRIGGKMTVYKWLSSYSPDSSSCKSEVIMTKKSSESIRDLRKRIRQLEQVVSDLSIEKKILVATIDVANETYGLDLKKNIGSASSNVSIKKKRERSRSKE